jgi:hypothetical protein
MIMYKLCPDHSIFGASNTVIRLSDNTAIPCAPDNVDFQQYQKWLSEGNTPLPAENE